MWNMCVLWKCVCVCAEKSWGGWWVTYQGQGELRERHWWWMAPPSRNGNLHSCPSRVSTAWVNWDQLQMWRDHYTRTGRFWYEMITHRLQLRPKEQSQMWRDHYTRTRRLWYEMITHRLHLRPKEQFCAPGPHDCKNWSGINVLPQFYVSSSTKVLL